MEKRYTYTTFIPIGFWEQLSMYVYSWIAYFSRVNVIMLS